MTDLPDAPELPEDALVVWGGDPRADGQLERMIGQARVSYDRGEGYALSVFVGWDPTKSREELIADIARRCKLPQRLLAVTTIGRVIQGGMRPVPDRPDGSFPCHVNIDLGNDMSEEDVPG